MRLDLSKAGVRASVRDGKTEWLLRPGDAVNLEIDMLARYVARLAEFK